MNIFLDGADFNTLEIYQNNPKISGYTTNPSLLKKDPNLTTYKNYAKISVKLLDKPVSFEIISDEPKKIIEESIEISSWSENINVKIPIVNSKGVTNLGVIETLVENNIPLNITAVFSKKQINDVSNVLQKSKLQNIISVFAGRIADTGVDPIEYIDHALNLNKNSSSLILWASPREVFNIYQASNCGCDIITVTPELYKKYTSLSNKDLEEFSTETSKMFYDDALSFDLNVFE